MTKIDRGNPVPAERCRNCSGPIYQPRSLTHDGFVARRWCHKCQLWMDQGRPLNDREKKPAGSRRKSSSGSRGERE